MHVSVPCSSKAAQIPWHNSFKQIDHPSTCFQRAKHNRIGCHQPNKNTWKPLCPPLTSRHPHTCRGQTRNKRKDRAGNRQQRSRYRNRPCTCHVLLPVAKGSTQPHGTIHNYQSGGGEGAATTSTHIISIANARKRLPAPVSDDDASNTPNRKSPTGSKTSNTTADPYPSAVP